MKSISKKVYEACKYADKNKTLSITKVSELFEVNRKTVSSHIKDYFNYTYPYEDKLYFISKEELEPIEYFINNSEVTTQEVCNKFHIKSNTLERRMTVMGLSYNRKYQRVYDRNKFDTIETEEDAYWLGFILADGYINEDRNFLSIKLGIKDYQHLVKFSNYMGEADPHISIGTGGSYDKTNKICSITFNSSSIVSNLKKYNLFQRKSGKEKPIEFTDENLKKAYIRGMIDGDGHVTNIKRFNYIGSLESCNYIKNFFNRFYDFKPDCSYIIPQGAVYKFQINNSAVNDFLVYLYKDAKIYLDRKYEIVKKIF